MLTAPDNLLFLYLLDDDLQDKLLHHLSRDGGEADWPVVLCSSLKHCLSKAVLVEDCLISFCVKRSVSLLKSAG